MYDNSRADEKRILADINNIVQILIELSYTKGTKKEVLYNNAVQLLKELRPCLLGLINGREELLESLTKQLISQKLPHPFMFNSFGDLQKDLNRVIAGAYTPYYNEKTPELQSPEAAGCPEADECPEVLGAQAEIKTADDSAAEVPAPLPTDPLPERENDQSCDHNPCDDRSIAAQIGKILSRDCAAESVYKNYYFRGMRFDFYLPSRKLALLFQKEPSYKHRLYESILKKEGVTVITFSGDNYLQASRKLRQLLSLPASTSNIS